MVACKHHECSNSEQVDSPSRFTKYHAMTYICRRSRQESCKNCKTKHDHDPFQTIVKKKYVQNSFPTQLQAAFIFPSSAHAFSSAIGHPGWHRFGHSPLASVQHRSQSSPLGRLNGQTVHGLNLDPHPGVSAVVGGCENHHVSIHDP